MEGRWGGYGQFVGTRFLEKFLVAWQSDQLIADQLLYNGSLLKDDAQELNRERGNTAFDAKCSEDSLWQVQIVREPQKVRPHVLEGVSRVDIYGRRTFSIYGQLSRELSCSDH